MFGKPTLVGVPVQVVTAFSVITLMAETSKKAKIVLSTLVMDHMHTNELHLDSELSPITPIPEDTLTSAPALPTGSGYWHRSALESTASDCEGPEYLGRHII